MSSSETSFRLINDYDELPVAAEKTTLFLEDHQASPEAVFAANLAIEELVTNTIKYGYDDTGRHEILIRLSLEPGELKIEISDDGHAFNPFDLAPPDTSLPVEEREIGGLGIHFVRNLLDSCEYRREAGENRVTLTKKL